MAQANQTPTRHYFVDEAGDGTIFDRKGKIITGTEGCSRYFMLGLVDVAEPDLLARELTDLRARLTADPYLRDVPSLKPANRKTALLFHAKDDVPEVRREVFTLLLRHNLRFYAAIKDKRKVAEYVQQRNQVSTQSASGGPASTPYRYRPNELYDFLVQRLFENRLRRYGFYQIHFAKRGQADRTDALRQAIDAARQRFTPRSQATRQAQVRILAEAPPSCVCLQATDYLLWALQRLYERREDRYWNFVQSAAHLVIDIDDTRETISGAYYSKKKPLSVAALTIPPEI